MSKKVLGKLFALATAVLALAGCAPDAPILIGLTGPFSESRGVSMRQAAELAVREVNARGGIAGATSPTASGGRQRGHRHCGARR